MHSELFHAVSYVYISLLEQPFVFPAVNNYFTFLLARFISIHITTTASPNSNRKSLVIFQCIRQSMIFIPVPFLRNTLSRSPHLPSPFRIGCFLDVYFCSHPWNAFPTFLLETWFWDSLSFFIVPHQKKKKKKNQYSSSFWEKGVCYENGIAYLSLAYVSQSRRIIFPKSCKGISLLSLASDFVVDHFNANLISDLAQVILFSSLRIFRIFILPITLKFYESIHCAEHKMSPLCSFYGWFSLVQFLHFLELSSDFELSGLIL